MKSPEPIKVSSRTKRFEERRGNTPTARSFTSHASRLMRPRPSQAGFTLIEVMMVLMMGSIMVLACLSTVTLMDRSSRRQALGTTALELAQGKIEELQAATYNPPVAPYYATNSTQSTNVVLLLDKTGASNSVTAVMTTI